MVEIWEPLGRYCRFERDERRARSSLRTICQIEMESCARFLPLQLKVAIYRLRADFQCNLAGAAEDAFAKVERRLRRIATRVYVVAAMKRVTCNCGCAALKVETVGQASPRRTNSTTFPRVETR